MRLSVNQNNVDKILKSVRQLTKNEVLVGIPDSNAERQETEAGEQVSNALIGYIQETGSPARNIPPRPFLVPGVSDARDGIVAQMKKGGQAALVGKPDEIERSQSASGLIAQSSVKAKITSNIPPALSQRTLAARRRRGVTRENSLVDTGQLLNAITYVVRPKGS